MATLATPTVQAVQLLMPLLQDLQAHPAHVFWPDSFAWNEADLFLSDELLHHGQITDTYLLALAVHHEGVLISFDQRLSPRSVRGGEAALQLIKKRCLEAISSCDRESCGRDPSKLI